MIYQCLPMILHDLPMLVNISQYEGFYDFTGLTDHLIFETEMRIFRQAMSDYQTVPFGIPVTRDSPKKKNSDFHDHPN